MLSALALLACTPLAASPNEQREEVLERPLGPLTSSCQKMLDMQILAHNRTRRLHKTIEARPDKKPRCEDQQASIKLSENTVRIVIEATNAIDMLEKEGWAVAFLEVFRELREDMQRVQRRLQFGDVGPVTQAIQRDIIDTLKEMLAALGEGLI